MSEKQNTDGSASSPDKPAEAPASMPAAAIEAAAAAAPGEASASFAGLAGEIGTEALSSGLAAMQSGGSPNAAAAAIAGTATAAAGHVVATAMEKQSASLSDRINGFVHDVESRLASAASGASGLIDHTPVLTAIVDFLGVRFPHDVSALRGLIEDAGGAAPPPAPPANDGGIPMARIGTSA